MSEARSVIVPESRRICDRLLPTERGRISLADLLTGRGQDIPVGMGTVLLAAPSSSSCSTSYLTIAMWGESRGLTAITN